MPDSILSRSRSPVPATLSMSRRRKAFNEGRRSAAEAAAENPYDNPTLRRLWELGREQQRAGDLTTPIPPLARGETRAHRSPQNPPGTKLAAPRPRPAHTPVRPRNDRGPGLGPAGRRPRGR